jgi:hypothetical protein
MGWSGRAPSPASEGKLGWGTNKGGTPCLAIAKLHPLCDRHRCRHHLLRILMGWPIVIDNWTVPMWLSWIALVIAGGLSYFGLSLVSRS